MNAACARITVRKPRRSPSAANTSSIDAAITISGATVGSVKRASIAPWRLKRCLREASAAAVAAVVATIVAIVPTIRLLRSEARIAGFAAARAYQSSVKPPQSADSRLALNDSAASTRIGAYKKR